jgi:purine catabolism regulator
MHEQGCRHVRGLSRGHLSDRPGQPVGAGVTHRAQGRENSAEQVVARGRESAAAADQGGDGAGNGAAGEPRRQRRHRVGHHRLERLEMTERELSAQDDLGPGLQCRPERAPPPTNADPGLAELDPTVADERPAEMRRHRTGEYQRGRQADRLWRADTDQRDPLVVSDDMHCGSERPDHSGGPRRALQQRCEHRRGGGEPADAWCSGRSERPDSQRSPHGPTPTAGMADASDRNHTRYRRRMGNVADPVAQSYQDLPDMAAGVTVREVLGMPAMIGARVLAGEAGLDRVVRRLNVMEVPDVLPWVKPHELLLTTGYPVRATPDGVPALLAALDDRGLAAVGIKLNRYLDSLPDEALVVAEQRCLPLVQLPDGIGFDDILNQVLTEVLNRQAALLERSEQVHRALVTVLLDGGGLDELVAEMAVVLGGPVLVTSADGRVLAEGGDPDQLARLRETSSFDPSGRFLTEREPPGTRGNTSAGWRAVVPVVAGRFDHGRIATFSRERPLDERDLHVLDRAATVAALAVTKQLAVNAVEGKYRGDFLRDVLSGRTGDKDHVVAHCRSLGWNLDRPLVVAVAELDPVADPIHPLGPELRPVQERFSAAWEGAVRMQDSGAPVVGFAQEVVALLPVTPGGDPDRVVRAIVRMVSGDGGGGRRSFSTGVSRVVDDPQMFPEAYEQARRAVEVGRKLHGAGAVAHFDALGSFRLLSLVRDPAELHRFVVETLGELVANGDPEAADLRHTLQVLLDTNLNVAEAARRLFVHYNTLRYRMGKLERLLGPFPTDPNLRLDVALALKVLQMRGID